MFQENNYARIVDIFGDIFGGSFDDQCSDHDRSFSYS